uniref:MyTH4 domain-containing protein n=1 Tax=Laticauda laticaudata TaxID=8630 RepID=A0A8C5WPA3_LATLA
TLLAVRCASSGRPGEPLPESVLPLPLAMRWRLLYILSAYYRCSEVFKPYLLQFLQGVSAHPGLHFQGIAKACEQNLLKTFKYGGRCEFPSAVELQALTGRSSKRQLFLLPGGIERHLKIKTCSVAQDVIQEICFEMGLQQPEAFREYIIFAVSSKSELMRLEGS